MKYEVLNCKSKGIDEVNCIRNAVFIAEQGVPYDEEHDSYDKNEETKYILVKDGDKAVATGRLIRTDKGLKLGRIAVLKELRGRGYGKEVVDALCKEAFENGAEEVYIYAQLHAVDFYKKLGFEIADDEIIIESNIPHKHMRRTKNG